MADDNVLRITAEADFSNLKAALKDAARAVNASFREIRSAIKDLTEQLNDTDPLAEYREGMERCVEGIKSELADLQGAYQKAVAAAKRAAENMADAQEQFGRNAAKGDPRAINALKSWQRNLQQKIGDVANVRQQIQTLAASSRASAENPAIIVTKDSGSAARANATNLETEAIERKTTAVERLAEAETVESEIAGKGKPGTWRAKVVGPIFQRLRVALGIGGNPEAIERATVAYLRLEDAMANAAPEEKIRAAIAELSEAYQSLTAEQIAEIELLDAESEAVARAVKAYTQLQQLSVNVAPRKEVAAAEKEVAAAMDELSAAEKVLVEAQLQAQRQMANEAKQSAQAQKEAAHQTAQVVQQSVQQEISAQGRWRVVLVQQQEEARQAAAAVGQLAYSISAVGIAQLKSEMTEAGATEAEVDQKIEKLNRSLAVQAERFQAAQEAIREAEVNLRNLASATKESLIAEQALSQDMGAFFGVRLPRALERVLQSIPGVNLALQSIFPVTSALLFIDIADQLVNKIIDMAHAWDAVYQAKTHADNAVNENVKLIQELDKERQQADLEVIQKTQGQHPRDQKELDILNRQLAEAERELAQVKQQKKEADEAAKGSEFAMDGSAAAMGGLPTGLLNAQAAKEGRTPAVDVGQEIAVAEQRVRDLNSQIAAATEKRDLAKDKAVIGRAEEAKSAVQALRERFDEERQEARAHGKDTAADELQIAKEKLAAIKGSGDEIKKFRLEAMAEVATLTKRASDEAVQNLRSSDKQKLDEIKAQQARENAGAGESLAAQKSFLERRLAAEQQYVERRRELQEELDAITDKQKQLGAKGAEEAVRALEKQLAKEQHDLHFSNENKRLNPYNGMHMAYSWEGVGDENFSYSLGGPGPVPTYQASGYQLRPHPAPIEDPAQFNPEVFQDSTYKLQDIWGKEDRELQLGTVAETGEQRTSDLEQQKLALQRETSLADNPTVQGKIAELQRIKEIDKQMIEEERQTAIALAKIKDAGDDGKFAQDQAKIEASYQRSMQRIYQINTEILSLQQQQWMQYFDKVGSGFNSAVRQWIQTGRGFEASMQNVGAGLVEDMAETWLKMGEQWIRMELQRLVTHVATNEETVASDATTAAQSTAISESNGIAQRFQAAETAAANTWASVSAIPIVGYALAPAAAAGAFAAVLAFEQGGVVPNVGGDIPAVLHKNEMVLSAPIAQHVLNSMGTDNKKGNSLSVTNHNSYQGLTDSAFQDMCSKHAAHLTNTVIKQARRANLIS